MNKFSIYLSLLCLMAALASFHQGAFSANVVFEPIAQAAESSTKQNVNYKKYYNSRFNYSVVYPSNILLQQEAPDNDNRRLFTSSNVNIEFKVTWHRSSMPLSAECDRLKAAALGYRYPRQC